ncbi:MAG: HD domain-containing phosphohydrolase, partial [Candidatus Omnitrophota bacterium]
RNQLKYVLFATLCGVVGIATNCPLLYDIKILPVGNILVSMYMLIITYAIAVYRVMDIRIFIKQASVFGIILCIAVINFGIFSLLAVRIPVEANIALIIRALVFFSIVIATFFLGKSAFGKLSAQQALYQEVLRRAADDISKVKTLDRLLRLCTISVHKNIPVEHATIIYLNRRGKTYILAHSTGRKLLSVGQTISMDSPLVEWFRAIKDQLLEMKIVKEEDTRVLLLEDLNAWLKDEKLRLKAELWKALLKLRLQIKGLNTSLCVPGFCKRELIGILLLGDKLSGDLFTQSDYNLLSQLADQVAMAADNFLITLEKEDLSFDMFLLTMETMEAKDKYTRFHSELSSRLCSKLAEKVQHKGDYRHIEDLLRKAEKTGLVHDIGKLKIKIETLNSPAKLTDEQWNEIKMHPQYSAEILSVVRDISPDIINGVLYHQEKWDGTGYPKGLKGKEIPPLARIAKLADSFEAMISDRPYRKGLPMAKIMEELNRCKDIDFDPDLVDAFMELYQEKEIDILISREKSIRHHGFL